MKKFIIENGFAILPMILPFLISNKWLYAFTRKTAGKLVSLITVKTANHPVKAVLGWFLNSVVTVCSAISDEVRGIPANGGSVAASIDTAFKAHDELKTIAGNQG